MKTEPNYLSKREQQLMDLVYEHGELSTPQATELLSGSPANSTVRTLLKILEDKGQLSHREENGKYIYVPTRSRQSAAKLAIDRLVQTFFQGSTSNLVVSLLSDPSTKLPTDEADRLRKLIESAQEEGR